MKIKIHNSIWAKIDFGHLDEKYWLNGTVRANMTPVKSETEISYSHFDKWKNLLLQWDLKTNEKTMSYVDTRHNFSTLTGNFI